MAVIGGAGIGHLFCTTSPVLRTPESLHFFPVAVPKTQTFLFSHCTPPANLVLTRNVRCSPFVVTSGNQHLVGSVTNVKGLRFAVIVARFNEIITNSLLEGALEAFRQYSVKEEDVTVVKVPGSFEIPIVAQKLGKSGAYHAIVCIGAVIRGDTTHYDSIVNSAASGVLNAGLSSGVPCVYGVLSCENMEQALNRAGGKSGNKGAEAALTAIEMASLFEHHLKEKHQPTESLLSQSLLPLC